MLLFACTPLLPMSPFVNYFGFPFPLYPGNVIFEWSLMDPMGIYFCRDSNESFQYDD